MGIENIMFLALGFLAAGLLALLITPPIIRRAARLTRRRIEASTPMTLNEFRADKDKLRAEFAIATRRAELQRERLRDKLAAQAVAFDAANTELAALRTERDEQFDAIRALQHHLGELRQRIEDLSRDNRTLSTRLSEAESLGAGAPQPDLATLYPGIGSGFDPALLSGDYEQDVEDLLMAIDLERQRADLFLSEIRTLNARLESRDTEAMLAPEPDLPPIPALRQSETPRPSGQGIAQAQAQIESAESRLAALLEHGAFIDDDAPRLAEELSRADDLDRLRTSVGSLEASILRDFRTRRFDAAALRADLAAIASDVSALLYAEDSEAEPDTESLFDRIRKFAGDTFEAHDLPSDEPVPVSEARNTGGVSGRMAALRQIRGN